MAAKTIALWFQGNWREENAGHVPKRSGIYVVYECSLNAPPQTVALSLPKTVTLRQIIYVGEAGDVNDRVAKHEKWPKWRQYCGKGNEICFSFAAVNGPDRARGEAALIYRHQPPANDQYKDTFPFDETTMFLEGETGLLESIFVVERDE